MTRKDTAEPAEYYARPIAAFCSSVDTIYVVCGNGMVFFKRAHRDCWEESAAGPIPGSFSYRERAEQEAQQEAQQEREREANAWKAKHQKEQQEKRDKYDAERQQSVDSHILAAFESNIRRNALVDNVWSRLTAHPERGFKAYDRKQIEAAIGRMAADGVIVAGYPDGKKHLGVHCWHPEHAPANYLPRI